MEAWEDVYMDGRLTPWQRNTLLVFIFYLGAKQVSVHHPSLMPGLVAKAVLCLRLIKIKSSQVKSSQIKSNLDSAVRKEEDRNLWTTMPPTALSSSAQNKRATDTCLPTDHAE